MGSRALNDFANQLAHGSTALSFILCGDFNAGPQSLVLRKFLETGWNFGEGLLPDSLSRYKHAARPPPLHERPRIDLIFRKSFGNSTVKMLPQFFVVSAASDHHPVMATVEVT